MNIASTQKKIAAIPAKDPAPPRVHTRKRLSRGELAPEARESIFRAAVKVVSEHGYTGATIARITEAAGIAQGTFYLYFDSREDLLDKLLPHSGAEMLAFIRDRVAGAKDVWDVEERGFRAFFEYVKARPGFDRVVTEAEVFAPNAFKKHFKLLIEHYVDALARSVDAGQIRNFDRTELEVLAYVLMSARSYLYLRYLKESKGRSIPEKAVKTYMKFVRNGLS